MIEIRTLDEMRAGRTVIQITVGSEPGADLPPAGDDRAMDQFIEKRDGMDEELERVRAKLTQVSEELAATQNHAEGLERTLATARLAEASRLRERDDQIKALERRLEAFRHGWNRTEEELQVARASEVSAARLAECNGKIESLETKLGLAHEDRANLKREVTRLEGELDAASRLAQSADTRRATAELRAEQARQRVEQLAADLDAATGHLLLRDGELASANDQRDAERSRAEQNKEWAERAESHLATARASLMQVRHELATSNDNFVTSQNRVKELEAINRELVAEARQREADPSTRLYTAAEVADAQTSEAELVTAPLNGRIIELEHELDNQYAEVGRAYEKLTSLSATVSGLDVMAALGEVSPGTPGDVLARAVRIARMTLGISKPRN